MSASSARTQKARRDADYADVCAEFGTRLRRERKQRQLIQEQVAKTVKVTQPRVSEWERGLSFPSIRQVLMFCKTYGIGLERLFGSLATFEFGQLPLEGLAADDRDALMHIADKLRQSPPTTA